MFIQAGCIPKFTMSFQNMSKKPAAKMETLEGCYAVDTEK